MPNDDIVSEAQPDWNSQCRGVYFINFLNSSRNWEAHERRIIPQKN